MSSNTSAVQRFLTEGRDVLLLIANEFLNDDMDVMSFARAQRRILDAIKHYRIKAELTVPTAALFIRPPAVPASVCVHSSAAPFSTPSIPSSAPSTAECASTPSTAATAIAAVPPWRVGVLAAVVVQQTDVQPEGAKADNPNGLSLTNSPGSLRPSPALNLLLSCAPPSIRSLWFDPHFNAPIEDWSLPPTLTEIGVRNSFGLSSLTKFQQPIERLRLSEGIKQFAFFPKRYLHPSAALLLPSSLTELRWGPCDLPILPLCLQSLHVQHGESLLRHQQLPPSLTLLYIQDAAGSLAQLRMPPSLTRLSFGYAMNVAPPASLPPRLQHLSFGQEFHHPLPSLPPSLLTLKLGMEFRQAWRAEWNTPRLQELVLGTGPIGELKLPSTLRVLQLADNFEQPVSQLTIPPSLTQLAFHVCNYPHPLLFRWPGECALTELDMVSLLWEQPGDQLSLPSSLLKLKMPRGWNQPLHTLKLPPSLTRMQFSFGFQQSLSGFVWPPSLLSLDLGANFNSPIEDWIPPPNLTELLFGEKFNQPLGTAIEWPQTLTLLQLRDEFDQSLEHWQPPASLRTLHIESDKWNFRPMRFPPNLTTLTLGNAYSVNAFNHPIAGLELPASLTQLSLGASFHDSLHALSTLPCLRRLVLDAHGYFAGLLSGAEWTLPESLEELRLPQRRWAESLVRLSDEELRPLLRLPSRLRSLAIHVPDMRILLLLSLPDSLRFLRLTGSPINPCKRCNNCRFPHSMRWPIELQSIELRHSGMVRLDMRKEATKRKLHGCSCYLDQTAGK